MVAAALKDQYGKPLLNGLIPRILGIGVGARVRVQPGLRHSCNRSTERASDPHARLESAGGLSFIYGIEIRHGEWHGNRGTRQEGLRPVRFGTGRAAFGLHAADHRAGLGRQSDAARPQAAGQSALRAGDDSRALSAPHRRLPPQGSAGHDRGRSGCALPLLRAAKGQGDPLRRDRGRRGAGVLRRRQGRPQAKSGRPGRRPPTSRSGSAAFPISSDRARTIRSARAASISSPATGTRSTASTAPTSRNTSARRFPPAASA